MRLHLSQLHLAHLRRPTGRGCHSADRRPKRAPHSWHAAGRSAAALAATALTLLAGGCAGAPGNGAPTPGSGLGRTATAASAPATTDPRGTEGSGQQAETLLAQLQVGGRDPWNNYSRALFGEDWADLDGDGCTTRNEILARDLTDVTLARNGCVVLAGDLHDPYSGEDVHFERGPDTSPLVQIDHIVPLSGAWRLGAQDWDRDTRIRFANDPDNLLAVAERSNSDKDNADAATWLPPNTEFRCEYAERVVTVKARYGLRVTQAEHDALADVLQNCT